MGVSSVLGHSFSLPDGRSIEATILSFDDRSGLVELERLDGTVSYREFTSPSSLSETKYPWPD